MTAAPCLWLSRFYKQTCIHPAHGQTCVGFKKCDDYEPDEGRVA